MRNGKDEWLVEFSRRGFGKTAEDGFCSGNLFRFGGGRPVRTPADDHGFFGGQGFPAGDGFAADRHGTEQRTVFPIGKELHPAFHPCSPFRSGTVSRAEIGELRRGSALVCSKSGFRSNGGSRRRVSNEITNRFAGSETDRRQDGFRFGDAAAALNRRAFQPDLRNQQSIRFFQIRTVRTQEKRCHGSLFRHGHTESHGIVSRFFDGNRKCRPAKGFSVSRKPMDGIDVAVSIRCKNLFERAAGMDVDRSGQAGHSADGKFARLKLPGGVR